MYNDSLDSLFDKWEKMFSEHQRNLFCRDGLLFKNGEPMTAIDEKWEKAKRRIVFIVKDKNTPDSDDIRRWLIEGKHAENCRNLSGGIVGKTGFLPNIARIFYGLMVTQKENRIGFAEVQESKMGEVRHIWNTEPFALIEAKKMAGQSSVSAKEIIQALNRDKELLTEELKILQPNIIVCCDSKGSQFKFITQHYLKDEEPSKIIKIEYAYPDTHMTCCLWYYPVKGITVIKSYHPTNRGKAKWMIYERVISPFHELFKNNIL